MKTKMAARISQDTSTDYRFKVQGFVSQRVADNMGLSLRYHEESERMITTLSGRVVDQAALIGILNTLYGLGFTLLSFESNQQ
jgi:hypothetical protein